MRRWVWISFILLLIIVLFASGPLDAFARGGGFGGGRGGFSGGGRSSGSSSGGFSGSNRSSGGSGYSRNTGSRSPGVGFFFFPFGFGSGGSFFTIIIVLVLVFIVMNVVSQMKRSRAVPSFNAPTGEWNVVSASFRLQRPEFYVPIMHNLIENGDFSDIHARSKALNEVTSAIVWEDVKDSYGGTSSQTTDPDDAGITAEKLNQSIVQALSMKATLVNVTAPETGGIQYDEEQKDFEQVMPESECILTIVTANRSTDIKRLDEGSTASYTLWKRWQSPKLLDCAALYISFTPDPGETLSSEEAVNVMVHIDSTLRRYFPAHDQS